MKRSLILWVLVLVGCDSLIPGIRPPQPSPKGQEVTVKVQVVDGKLVVTDGKLSVGEGKIQLTGDATSQAVCNCGCGKDGCACSRGASSAAQSTNTTAGGIVPQFITQTQMVYQCRGGKCGWYPVEVRVPVAPASKRLAAPATHGGKITVYTNGSPACVAMESALRGVSGVEFQQISSNGIAGVSIVPTAVKLDGSKWSPARGWHSGSLNEFLAWSSGQ